MARLPCKLPCLIPAITMQVKLFLLQPTTIAYEMREMLMMRRVSGRWSPKCWSLLRDAGDMVGLDWA